MGGSRATTLFLIRGLYGRSERRRPSGARTIYRYPGLTAWANSCRASSAGLSRKKSRQGLLRHCRRAALWGCGRDDKAFLTFHAAQGVLSMQFGENALMLHSCSAHSRDLSKSRSGVGRFHADHSVLHCSRAFGQQRLFEQWPSRWRTKRHNHRQQFPGNTNQHYVRRRRGDEHCF